MKGPGSAMNPLKIKDTCRGNLTSYLIQAISVLPRLNNPLILDMGCGSGVPTLILAQHFNSTIYAVDTDETALEYLEEKIAGLNLGDRIIVMHRSVYDLDFAAQHFDMIVAEGLLNMTGFDAGLSLADRFIKDDGYFIIHDEYAHPDEKEEIIRRSGYRLIHSFILDEQVWWKDYIQCLEKKLGSLDQKTRSVLFKNEMNEIRLYKEQPLSFRSIYYILKKSSRP
jgi:ubiquinone/menaquinone biosynthesis C-methylase UbiE